MCLTWCKISFFAIWGYDKYALTLRNHAGCNKFFMAQKYKLPNYSFLNTFSFKHLGRKAYAHACSDLQVIILNWQPYTYGSYTACEIACMFDICLFPEGKRIMTDKIFKKPLCRQMLSKSKVFSISRHWISTSTAAAIVTTHCFDFLPYCIPYVHLLPAAMVIDLLSLAIKLCRETWWN